MRAEVYPFLTYEWCIYQITSSTMYVGACGDTSTIQAFLL